MLAAGAGRGAWRDRSGTGSAAILAAVLLGFGVIATSGTQRYLVESGVPAEKINKVLEGRPHIEDAIRNRQVQIVFQNPYASLNPRFAIGQTLVEPMAIHGIGAGAAELEKRPGDSLAIGFLEALPTLDPHSGVMHFDLFLLNLIYEGLTAIGPDGSIQPALATAWRRVLADLDYYVTHPVA